MYINQYWHSTEKKTLNIIKILIWYFSISNKQGGPRIKMEYLGSNFLVKPSELDLPTYVIRHISIYGNMTSSPWSFWSSTLARCLAGFAYPISWGYLQRNVGWALVSRTTPFFSVDTVGMSAAVEANVPPCNDVDGVIDEGTVGMSAAVEANVPPCNDVDGVIDEGTGKDCCREKNENKVGRFASFSSLWRFAFAFKQVFIPRWFFSRLASPAVPQWIRVLQSGHTAYPSASRTGL